jgi:hypothetical protein
VHICFFLMVSIEDVITLSIPHATTPTLASSECQLSGETVNILSGRIINGTGHVHLSTCFKTLLCREYYLTRGACTFGDTCCFAHSLVEVKPLPSSNHQSVSFSYYDGQRLPRVEDIQHTLLWADWYRNELQSSAVPIWVHDLAWDHYVKPACQRQRNQIDFDQTQSNGGYIKCVNCDNILQQQSPGPCDACRGVSPSFPILPSMSSHANESQRTYKKRKCIIPDVVSI